MCDTVLGLRPNSAEFHKSPYSVGVISVQILLLILVVYVMACTCNPAVKFEFFYLYGRAFSQAVSAESFKLCFLVTFNSAV